ncbi:MAG: hypothetical protein HY717_08665 [Planctomycetes bacterium]|nr:hypothetical protein [Planctomycetota bacterium]
MLGKIRRKRFGEILVGEGLISQEQMEEALEIQKKSGDSIGAILLDLGYITEADIVKTLSIQYQLPYLRPSNYKIDRKVLEIFEPLFLHRQCLLPLDRIGDLLLVLVTDIPSREVVDQLQEGSKCDLAMYLGSSNEVQQALNVMLPISEEQDAQIRAERVVSRPESKDDEPGSDEAPGQASEGIDFSSEKILSSLDAAWDSIFVENPDGKAEGEED